MKLIDAFRSTWWVPVLTASLLMLGWAVFEVAAFYYKRYRSQRDLKKFLQVRLPNICTRRCNPHCPVCNDTPSCGDGFWLFDDMNGWMHVCRNASKVTPVVCNKHTITAP